MLLGLYSIYEFIQIVVNQVKKMFEKELKMRHKFLLLTLSNGMRKWGRGYPRQLSGEFL